MRSAARLPAPLASTDKNQIQRSTLDRSMEVRRCLKTVWDNCAGSIARPVCTAAQSDRSGVAGVSHAGSILLSVNFVFQDRRQPGHQDAGASGPVSGRTTVRSRTAPYGTLCSQDETSICSPSFAGPPRWHCRRAWSLVMPRPGQKVSKYERSPVLGSALPLPLSPAPC